MAQKAADRGIDLVGFVGHDERPSVPDDLPITVMTGVEEEVTKQPRRLHILRFPDQDLSILAHPKLTFPEQTGCGIGALSQEFGIDAVELHSRGTRQLPDNEIPRLPAVGADDAHTTHAVGCSVTEVDAPADPDAVATAIKQGDCRSVNRGLSLRSRAAHKLHQGINLLAAGEV